MPFFSVNSSAARESPSDAYCHELVSGTNLYNYCYPQAQNPTLLNLANGDLGLGYSAYTSQNATNCPGSNGATSGRIAFEVSADGGATFGAPTYLGNTTCRYLQAIEPSFAATPDGHVFAAFVEENHSAVANPRLPRDYGSTLGGRSADALGFVNSTDNGSTFGAVTTITSGGNISRPQTAAFGKSVYVVYENISNSSICVGFACIKSVALHLLYSPDNGATWRGPYSLPGLGATWNFTAMSPSIAVNASGTVAVAYATNRACAYSPFSFCSVYGDDIVVAESSSNGSTWSSPTTVATAVGESANYLGYFLPQFFQQEPSTSIAYAPNGTALYVAWAGTYNHTTRYIFGNYQISGIFAARSFNGGRSWSAQPIAAQLNGTSLDSYFGVAVGAGPSGAELTYTDFNTSYCANPPCSPLVNAYVQWVVSSTNGTSFGPPQFLSLRSETTTPYGFQSSWPGYSASVLLTGSGPRIAYSLVDNEVNTQSPHGGGTLFNLTFATNLSVARPVPSNGSLYLNFSATHRPLGSLWAPTVDGVAFPTTASFVNVTGIPANQFLFLGASNITVSPLRIRVPALGLRSYIEFNASRVIRVNYSADYSGVYVAVAPANIGFGGGEQFQVAAGNDSFDDFSGTGVGVATPAFPWYFLTGSNVSFRGSGFPIPPLYWVGLGPGNYSGPGANANVTMVGPLNETLWLGVSASGSVEVAAPGLPTSSRFRFQWDGAPESGIGGSSVDVVNVSAGGHRITNITANSSAIGSEYFGQADTANPVLVPITPLVNLTFALVDLTSTPGVITFQAPAAVVGSLWEMEFNGTVYSSDTPWINVTEHAGTFPAGAFPFTGGDGVSHYVPTQTIGPLAVVPGHTYSIAFSPAFQLTVLASTGGSASPATQYVAAGATVAIRATVATNFGFVGWAGGGNGSYSGPGTPANVTVSGPVTELAQFVPLPLARFNLTFRALGLPAGTEWSVSVNGTGHAGSGSTIVVGGLYPSNAPGGQGLYPLSVPTVFANSSTSGQFTAIGYPANVSTNGTTVVPIVFEARFLVSVVAGVGGSVSAVVASGPLGLPSYVANNTLVQITASSAVGYQFANWSGSGPGSYSGPAIQWTLQVNGSANETAVFAVEVQTPVPTFTLELVETAPLPAGTIWTAQVGAFNASSSGTTLNVTGLIQGEYSIQIPAVTSADGRTRYGVAIAIPAQIVDRDAIIHFAFSASFQVLVTASSGGSVPPLTGWIPNGSLLALNATPDLGQVFTTWSGIGPGSYSGANQTENVTVTAPITEVAAFVSVPSSHSTNGLSGSSSVELALLAAGVVLVVVAVAVLLIARSRRRPPAVSPPSDPTAPDWEEPT
ncbi:MAG: glycoside hydrolase [Thermoplasmata archaeon]|nr:glycoside hydrolase [Thermoplasmata archaeon]